MLGTFTVADVAASLGCELPENSSANLPCQGGTHDSRAVKPGHVFFAVGGNVVDGHDYVAKAAERGAACAVVNHTVPAAIPQLVVPDTIAAMGAYAAMIRKHFAGAVIGVTGSVGKTSAKDIIHHVLNRQHASLKNDGNFNNEIGAPLSVMQLDGGSYQSAVFELAMRGSGQIAYLAKIVRPHIAVITNVGTSHIELLGSREAIAEAKSEILSEMDEDGFAILNADCDFFSFIKERCPGRAVAVGRAASADYRITEIAVTPAGGTTASINGHDVRIPKCWGEHFAWHAGAALAVVAKLGLDNAEALAALADFEAPDRRGNFRPGIKDSTIVDATYNSAPDSVAASIATLLALRSDNNRLIAVLGDMFELGSYSRDGHRDVGSNIPDGSLDLLVTVGEQSAEIGRSARVANWQHFADNLAAARFLAENIKSGDAVLVQGSNGMRMDEIVNKIAAA